ncbi:MAG: selenide, water dikinase SelD [Psychrosphaera sp.]|nr:selenide, water dikinase SelD [Psychrosphaera sp.]
MALVKLTQYSHGAGCGCKISPKTLDIILASQLPQTTDANLIVGNKSKDDAAVYDIGNGQGIVSTTDFFMPILDDPFDFGRVAATNAISDIYAMGGKPLMAIAILGWPVNVLSAEIAQQVLDGGRQACFEAGIQLAGGHSIDSPEPIFGLAVTGIVPLEQLKRNDTATKGCTLYLTKPLGVGILTTAQKQDKLKPEHQNLARDTMCQLNTPGMAFAQLDGVKAMTDVTGFGLMGHLVEVCEGSNLSATIDESALPLLEPIEYYRQEGCIPGGTTRNFESYGHKVAPLSLRQQQLLCDPQTSGGLLVAVSPDGIEAFLACAETQGLTLAPIGQLDDYNGEYRVTVK